MTKLPPSSAKAAWTRWHRATDTKLNRDVAIKVLPDAFASDPDRLARFTREAQVLASLNHPNIAAIYGVEDRALILELVEGADLKGPLPNRPLWSRDGKELFYLGMDRKAMVVSLTGGLRFEHSNPGPCLKSPCSVVLIGT